MNNHIEPHSLMQSRVILIPKCFLVFSVMVCVSICSWWSCITHSSLTYWINEFYGHFITKFFSQSWFYFLSHTFVYLIVQLKGVCAFTGVTHSYRSSNVYNERIPTLLSLSLVFLFVGNYELQVCVMIYLRFVHARLWHASSLILFLSLSFA